jgi:hypothetical protein
MAQAPTPLTPPAPQEPAAKPPAAKPPPRRPAPSQTAPSTPAPAATAPSTARGEPDLAYGAFQRGSYLTAFSIATRRASELEDVKAVTLLGELARRDQGGARVDTGPVDHSAFAALIGHYFSTSRDCCTRS